MLQRGTNIVMTDIPEINFVNFVASFAATGAMAIQQVEQSMSSAGEAAGNDALGSTQALATVQHLIDMFRQTQAPLLVPTFNGERGHPVLFRRMLFEELLNDALPEGARTVVHRHLDDTTSVPVDDEGTVINIDDMTAYRRHYPDEYHHHLLRR